MTTEAVKKQATELATVETQNHNAIVIPGVDPFAAYADAIAPKFILGQLLRFSKGDYVAGERDELIPLGTKFIAGVDLLLTGWVRWEGGKPVEHRMVRVIDGHSPDPRSELGYLDQSTWEKDAAGEPRDPWQLTNYLPMVDEANAVFTFTTSSRGGMSALADLCRSYSKSRQSHADDFPVIELRCGSYQHQNAQFGRIKFPEFKRVGWVSKSGFLKAIGEEDAIEQQQQEEEFSDSIPF
jgi:hypothetical protein